LSQPKAVEATMTTSPRALSLLIGKATRHAWQEQSRRRSRHGWLRPGAYIDAVTVDGETLVLRLREGEPMILRAADVAELWRLCEPLGWALLLRPSGVRRRVVVAEAQTLVEPLCRWCLRWLPGYGDSVTLIAEPACRSAGAVLVWTRRLAEAGPGRAG
jgi:hypothetical protein